MSRTRSNAPGGCRLGLGCILLFSLSTNAYLIFLFHRMAGRGGGAPAAALGAWDGMGGPPVPERWQQQGNVGSGESEGPDSEPAIEAVGRRGLRGGAEEEDLELTAAEEKPSLRGSNMSREEGTDDSEREVTAEAEQEEEGTGKAEKPTPSREEASDVNDAKVVAGEEQNPPADGQGQSLEEKPWPKPDGWEDMGFYDIRKHFDCSTYAHDPTKPLPTLEDWQFFRKKYIEIVDNAKKFDDPVPPTDGYALGDGGPPPYYAAHSKDGRGRGLFASRDIKKGELVDDGDIGDVVFPSAMAWRRYIFALPRNKACDMIDWSWTQRKEENGPWLIVVGMNVSVLSNTESDEDSLNVNPKSSTSSKFYATRDIKEGEELLTDYEIYDTVWDKVGLGSENYVDDDDDDEPSTDEEEQQPSDKAQIVEKKNAVPTDEKEQTADDVEPQAEKESQSPEKQQSPREAPLPLDGWESMGFYDIRKHFDCSTYAHDQTKPLPTLEDWQFFRDKYRAIVDDTQEFDDPVPPTDGYTFGDGGPPPYYAAHSKDGRGRGLFASRDIKKGELVHNGEQSDILVPSGVAWRKFIFALPRKKACDVIDWTWTAKTEKKGPWKIFTAMNISILLNGGTKDTWNVNPKSSISSKMYATRDIKKDEELLTDYDIYDTVWHKVGLGSEDDDGSEDEGDGDDDDGNVEEENAAAAEPAEQQSSIGAKEGETTLEPSTDQDEQQPSDDEDKGQAVEKKSDSPTDGRAQSQVKKSNSEDTKEQNESYETEPNNAKDEFAISRWTKELITEKNVQTGKDEPTDSVEKVIQRLEKKRSEQTPKTVDDLSPASEELVHERKDRKKAGLPRDELGIESERLKKEKDGLMVADDNVEAQAEKERQSPEKQQSPEEKPWPKPDGWKKMSFYQIRKHFNCSPYAHDQTKPLPTLEDWQFLRDKYREIVDDSIEFDDPVPPTEGYTFGDGGPPPYYAAHSKDGRGRGLFASRDIKEGELVHNGEQSDIIVPSGMAWRRFVFALPRTKSCDVIDWTWTEKSERKGPWKLLTAMNISILCNGGNKRTWNVNPKSSTSSKFYATRDIKKGEELLTDYDMYDTVWHKVGL